MELLKIAMLGWSSTDGWREWSFLLERLKRCSWRGGESRAMRSQRTEELHSPMAPRMAYVGMGLSG
jgi:hypothetical protein